MQWNLAWYDHFPEAVMTVMENYQVKLQWDFRIQTDHHLDHNRPDIVVLEKKWRRCFIVDVPCPYFDTRLAEKEKEKIQHVSGLKSGSAIWNCRSVISVIPIVIGALGTVSKHLRMWISKLGTPGIIALLQKACLLGTAKILHHHHHHHHHNNNNNNNNNNSFSRCWGLVTVCQPPTQSFYFLL